MHHSNIQRILLEWFRTTARDLPWRHTYDPYHIWISEIMLQQTQMERGIAYFTRWLERFPDVKSVAEATEQEILKFWEGLGYYSRARNLYSTARMIQQEYGGIVPCDPEILLKFPGIGNYTAAAISSIACNYDVAVIDANVSRVYARIFDIDVPVTSSQGQNWVKKIAWSMLPENKARQFNQAMMDFGGLICLPRAPKCDICPIADFCLANTYDRVGNRPVPKKKVATIHISMATGILIDKGKIFIQQRRADDIWGGLWEFPGGSVEQEESAEEAVVREYREETGLDIEVCSFITTVVHFYTRYKVTLHCFGVRPVGSVNKIILDGAAEYRWVATHELGQFGFPAGHRKVLEFIASTNPDLLKNPCNS